MDPELMAMQGGGGGGGMGGGLMGGLFGLGQSWMNNNAAMARQQQQLANAWKTAKLQSSTQKDVANINVAPQNLLAGLQQQRFGRGNDLYNSMGGGAQGGWLANILSGNDQAGGPNPLDLAQQYAPQGNAFGNMFAGAQNQFAPMPPGMFQTQLNQIMGGAASGLGGQLRSSNAQLAGSGMAPGSAVGQGLRNQYGAQALAGAQGNMANAFQNKYQQDFGRQQAQAGYNTNLGGLLLNQQGQRQQYGLGLGGLGLQGQQLATTRRGQGLTLAQSLFG